MFEDLFKMFWNVHNLLCAIDVDMKIKMIYYKKAGSKVDQLFVQTYLKI